MEAKGQSWKAAVKLNLKSWQTTENVWWCSIFFSYIVNHVDRQLQGMPCCVWCSKYTALTQKWLCIQGQRSTITCYGNTKTFIYYTKWRHFIINILCWYKYQGSIHSQIEKNRVHHFRNWWSNLQYPSMLNQNSRIDPKCETFIIHIGTNDRNLIACILIQNEDWSIYIILMYQKFPSFLGFPESCTTL